VGSPAYQVTGPVINGESLYGITFDGSASYFNIASTLTDPSAAGFTLTGWMKAPQDASVKRPVFWFNSSAQGIFYLRFGNAYGVDGVTINDASGVHGEAFDGTDHRDDSWQFVGLRYDVNAAVLRSYHVSATYDDTSFTGTWQRVGNPSVVRIGGGGGLVWDGELALIGYWDVPLTDDEITALRTGTPFSTPQLIYPDADVSTTGWATAPLWSKIDEASPDGTVITATAS
jgi:hypothetical protein